MPAFNLVDEPWIPCLMQADGALRLLSLRDTLARASEVREITDPSPRATVAVHRLLLAILHRTFGPASTAEWAALWQRGQFGAAALHQYLDRWQPRFELFDGARLFYPVGSLDYQYAVPISRLLHELTSGSNTTLFDHTRDDRPPALSPAEAARALLAHQAFAVGGLVSLEKGQDPALYKAADGAPLVKTAVCVMKGDDLFRTLMLNLHGYRPGNGMPFDPQQDDRPAWERDEETQAGDRVPDGYLDLLTWQSRRIRLKADVTAGGVVVRAAVIMKGFQFPDGHSLLQRETMVAFKASKAGPFPIAFREDRTLWRDSLALFQSVEGTSWRPLMVDWIGELMSQGILPPSTVPIDVFGLVTNQARVSLWRHERLPVPLAYLDQPTLVGRLRAGLEAAEDAAGLLNRCARRVAGLLLSPVDPQKAAAKEVRDLVEALAPARPYWPRLGPAFHKLVLELSEEAGESPAEGASSAALRAWADAVETAAREAFAGLSRALDGTPRALKALAVAGRDFHRGLVALMKPYRDQEEFHAGVE